MYIYIIYIILYICHQCVCAHYPYRNSSIHYTRCPKAPGLNHHLSVGSVARWINVGIFANIGIWPRQRWGLWNFPLKMVIFYSYVSLPEGIWSYFDGDVIARNKRLTRKEIDLRKDFPLDLRWSIRKLQGHHRAEFSRKKFNQHAVHLFLSIIETLPSGKHTKNYWTWSIEIVDLPIKDCDFP